MRDQCTSYKLRLKSFANVNLIKMHFCKCERLLRNDRPTICDVSLVKIARFRRSRVKEVED
jgi:hypothetical protein